MEVFFVEDVAQWVIRIRQQDGAGAVGKSALNRFQVEARLFAFFQITVGRANTDIDALAPGSFWQFQKRWVSRQWNHDGGVRAGEILDSQQQATHDIADPENLLRVWTPAVALGVELRDRSAEIYSARCWAVAKAFALGVFEQHIFDNRRGRKIAFGNKKWQDIGLKLSPLTGKTGA